MERFWKQYVGSGTASSHSVFFKARLKLTAQYVLIVAIIVFGFSLFLYQGIGHNLRVASDDDFAGVGSHQRFVENTLAAIENDLVLADLVILIVTAGLSFVLAGKTLKPIQRSVEVQKAFATNASHELRTPLAVMRSDIEVFLRNNAQTKELLHMTMNSNLQEIKRMSGIVEDLLLLARSDNQALPGHRDVDLSMVLRSVIERIKSLADSKNIKLILDAPNSAIIKGAEGSLERVLLNILQNSLDHTPIGGSISAKIQKEKSQVVLRVTDTGSGIVAKDLPHIFKRFYKGDSDTGTGLGLSIVKEIVDQHHGSISVGSVGSGGVTFTICFPLK